VRPTDTQCPSIEPAGAFPELAGRGGSGRGFNSKFWTIRASVVDVVAAFASVSGRRQIHDVAGQRGIDFFTTRTVPNEESGSLVIQHPALFDSEHAGWIVAGSAHNSGQAVA